MREEAPWAGDSPLTVRCTQLPLWKVSYCCSSIRTLHSYQPWSSERTGSIWREAFPCREALPGDRGHRRSTSDNHLCDCLVFPRSSPAMVGVWTHTTASVTAVGGWVICFHLFLVRHESCIKCSPGATHQIKNSALVSCKSD